MDPVTNLGLSAESVFSYYIGEIIRTKGNFIRFPLLILKLFICLYLNTITFSYRGHWIVLTTCFYTGSGVGYLIRTKERERDKRHVSILRFRSSGVASHWVSGWRHHTNRDLPERYF